MAPLSSLSFGLFEKPPEIMQNRRYAFICGLHRSGTTLIARTLARHPMVSGFRDTGTIEDEGQFLQSVLPLETAFGGVGRFGFDPRAHMTDESQWNTPECARKILAEWTRYWDTTKPVLLEKTPGNLLRMRLLAKLFDPAYFIVVTRHPVATALATMKWTEGNLFSLISHWVHCYRIARADGAFVSHVHWVSYEQFIADPDAELSCISGFLGLETFSDWNLRLRDENAAYFDLWRTCYLGDTERAIEQLPPERPRSLLTRLRERLTRDARERALPVHRKRENRRNFHDALDAVALHEPAISEFGYSFNDLSRKPRLT